MDLVIEYLEKNNIDILQTGVDDDKGADPSVRE